MFFYPLRLTLLIFSVLVVEIKICNIEQTFGQKWDYCQSVDGRNWLERYRSDIPPGFDDDSSLAVCN